MVSEKNLGYGVMMGALYGIPLYIGLAYLLDHLVGRHQCWGADTDIYTWGIAFFAGPVLGLLLGFATVGAWERRASSKASKEDQADAKPQDEGMI